MLINSAWAVQRFWKGCVGRWWWKGKWGRKGKQERRCCLVLQSSAHNFVFLKETAFPSLLRKDGRCHLFYSTLAAEAFLKNSPEVSDFQWMRSVFLLKPDNAIHTAIKFELLCPLNHRNFFHSLLQQDLNWPKCTCVWLLSHTPVAIRSVLTHLQYLWRCLSTSGFCVHLLVSVWC